MRTWDINKSVVSAAQCEVIPDKTDVDADAADGGKAVMRRPINLGLLRRLVWPVSDISSFCCAADECYL